MLETSSKLPKRIPTQRYLTLFQCLPSRHVATQSYTHTIKILEESRWIKSGGLEMLCKKVFTGKHMCQSFFFNNVAELRPATLFKKEILAQCFSVNFAKFLRNVFLQKEQLRWLLPMDFVLVSINQKQPSEVFCKKSCSQKFRKIHMETPVPESLF